VREGAPPFVDRRAEPRRGLVTRVGLVLTATGLMSISAIARAATGSVPDWRDTVAFGCAIALLVASSARRPAPAATLIALAALALILAAVGIHGLLAFTVAQRDREIGVRLALGASPATVGGMIVKDGVQMALFGVVPGIVLAWLAARWMSSLLFGVQPSDPATIAVVALLCFGTAVAACVRPALRAARIQPLAALREE